MGESGGLNHKPISIPHNNVSDMASIEREVYIAHGLYLNFWGNETYPFYVLKEWSQIMYQVWAVDISVTVHGRASIFSKWPSLLLSQRIIKNLLSTRKPNKEPKQQNSLLLLLLSLCLSSVAVVVVVVIVVVVVVSPSDIKLNLIL